MDLPARLAAWPVGSATVAVIGRSGVLDVVDDGKAHPWASVTKVLTAIAVLDATMEGVVSLDDPVGPPGSTLRHLLCHASGLSLDSDHVLARPGTRRIYSNRGIDLAAEHLETRTGRPFSTELHERVLDLLEMSSTELVGPPAHGARGPIEDLATLAGELLRPRLLMPDVVRLASTVSFPGLAGMVPGFGKQATNDWGLGCESLIFRLRMSNQSSTSFNSSGESLAGHRTKKSPLSNENVSCFIPGRKGGIFAAICDSCSATTVPSSELLRTALSPSVESVAPFKSFA